MPNEQQKIKSVAQFQNDGWSTPIPLGANAENIDITSATTNPIDQTNTKAGLIADEVTVGAGDTDATAWTKFNKFRKRVYHTVGDLAGKIFTNSYEQNNTDNKIYSATVINNQLATKAVLDSGIRPNLLDNWYFVGGGSQQSPYSRQFPFNNQRGLTTYPGVCESIDRWQSWESANTTVIMTDYITITKQLGQGLKEGPKLINNTVTVSALFTNNKLISGTNKVTITPGQAKTVVAGSEANFANVLVYYDGANFTFQVNLVTPQIGTATGVKAVKLEFGSSQTLAHQENGTWVLNEIPNWNIEYQKYNPAIGSNLATVEYNRAASKSYAIGEYLVYNGKLYQVTTAFSQGTSLTPGTNITETKISNGLSILKYTVKIQINAIPANGSKAGSKVVSAPPPGTSFLCIVPQYTDKGYPIVSTWLSSDASHPWIVNATIYNETSASANDVATVSVFFIHGTVISQSFT